MSTARLHQHPSLPPAVFGASSGPSHSKSHVLAGVQDAYWSDEEAEDAECPLCLEEMDIADMNFKPCPCGYQVCRFCWHHIKENLNGRCPACRREYSDEAVQFQPIEKADHKRLTQQKKQRERERKELDALGRRHLANVRVVQRNVVYVVGLGPRFAKEELIPTLRSNEYFGQYGKISKILLVKRTPPDGRTPVVGLYITYHRREDASRAISAVDGTPSPGGGNELMRASHGTTKYCMAFLRSVTCSNHGCMDLHEWGDERDCFTKEDLTTLKHTLKDTESQQRANVLGKKSEEVDTSLPRSAGWGSKATNALGTSTLNNAGPSSSSRTQPSSSSSQRQTRRGEPRGTRAGRSNANATAPESRQSGRTQQERRGGSSSTAIAGKASSQASSSRPPTPASVGLPTRPMSPPNAKTPRNKEKDARSVVLQPRSPTSSVAVDSDVGSWQDVSTSPALRPQSVQSVQSVQSSSPSIPPGIPAAPPGLSAPPGFAGPPGLTLPPSSVQPPQSSYQMSTQARALLDDMKARRVHSAPSTFVSPFPDFDRTLQNLSGGDAEYGGFSFNLDPKLADEDVANVDITLPELDTQGVPFSGSLGDGFAALKSAQQGPSSYMPPPGLQHVHSASRSTFDSIVARPIERQQTGGSSYTGSFNPFSDTNDESATKHVTSSPLLDEDSSRRVSRFDFARPRRGSSALSATSSSFVAASPTQSTEGLPHSASHVSDVSSQSHGQWGFHSRNSQYDHGHPLSNSFSSGLGSSKGSPLVQNAQAHDFYHQQPQPAQQAQQSRFQPFDSGLAENALKEMIGIGRERPSASRTPSEQHSNAYPGQPFNDPAIMSARRGPAEVPVATGFSHAPGHLQYGPPPGLNYGLGGPTSPALSSNLSQAAASSPAQDSSFSSPMLSPADFPALSTEAQAIRETGPSPPQLAADSKEHAKMERKAAKKQAAAEKAIERQRIAQEKTAARAAEKERMAQEKAEEKERADKEKVLEMERAAAFKAEQEKAEQGKVERERETRENEAAKKAAKERKAEEKAARETELQAEKAAAAQAKKAAVTTTSVKPKFVADGGPNTKGQPLEESSTPPVTPSSQSQKVESTTRKQAQEPVMVPEPINQVPILSKMPKKFKATMKPIKIAKEDETILDLPSAVTSESSHPVVAKSVPVTEVTQSKNSSRQPSLDRATPHIDPTSITQLLMQIDAQLAMHLAKHPFFDLQNISPATKMPLEYVPLVHALSALSVGGGSFASSVPSGSIDNAVASFQQLLETLTQTISDLLRLLPRTTWDDSTSFDGVLRDMLKGDDFLDDGSAGDNSAATGKEDEVAALTLALERRARWMEVQLSKLEELHRDINTAAVRAVLAFNDRGWDTYGFMPRVGGTLARFDMLGMADVEGGEMREMTIEEMEKKLVVAQEEAGFSEAELRGAMTALQVMVPF